MKIPVLGRAVDERFLSYRLRSSSVAGIVGALVALVILEYRIVVDHRITWDLLAVLAAMVVVKLSMMAWFLVRN